MSHHHHSCSDSSSIFTIAIGVMFGIWAAKIVPILIIGVIGLVIWLVFLVVRLFFRVLGSVADGTSVAIRKTNNWLLRHSSPALAGVFWFFLIAAGLSSFFWLLIRNSPHP